MRPRKNIRPQQVFSVIVDGETEIWYFNMLKRNAGNINVNILPRLPQKKTIEEQYELVKEQAKTYDKVFWIIDFDVVLMESKVAKKGKKKPLASFTEIRNEVSRNHKNVIIIINNPCIEFWFLLHFEKSGKFFNTCKSAEKQLKKHLNDYKKNQAYFTKQGKDIFLRLQENLGAAIENAASLAKFDPKSPENAMAEMHLFFQSEESLMKLATK